MNQENYLHNLIKVYEATGGNQRVSVNLKDVLSDGELSLSEIEAVGDYMQGEGWISFLSDETLDVYITHAGIKAAQMLEQSAKNEVRDKSQNRQQETQIPTLDIFVSHSSRDADVAEALIELLRAALYIPPDRIRCTSVQGYKLKGGASTDETLRKEVHDTVAFIGLITDASLQSAYVLFELGARWGAGRHLLPVLASGTTSSVLRGPLTGINTLRLDEPADIHQIIDDIAEELNKPKASASTYQKQLEALIRIQKEKPASGEKLSPPAPHRISGSPEDAKIPARIDLRQKPNLILKRVRLGIAQRNQHITEASEGFAVALVEFQNDPEAPFTVASAKVRASISFEEINGEHRLEISDAAWLNVRARLATFRLSDKKEVVIAVEWHEGVQAIKIHEVRTRTRSTYTEMQYSALIGVEYNVEVSLIAELPSGFLGKHRFKLTTRPELQIEQL